MRKNSFFFSLSPPTLGNTKEAAVRNDVKIKTRNEGVVGGRKKIYDGSTLGQLLSNNLADHL